MFQHKRVSLIRKLCILALLAAALFGSSLGSAANKASACPTCFSESATAYVYCRDNPGGVYSGCNFSHTCRTGESANSIYREECLLSH